MKMKVHRCLLQLALLQLLLSASKGTPTIQFSFSPGVTIMEGESVLNMTMAVTDVRFVWLTSTPASATVTEGTDYLRLSRQYDFGLSFHLVTISIFTLEDSVFEDAEVFTVTARNRDFSLITTATVTITDDDVATVSLRDSTVMTTESSGSVEVCARLDGPAGGLERTVDIQLTQSNGSGQAAVTGTISSGAMPGDTQCLNVPIQNDNVFEDEETFTVSLSSSQSRVTATGTTTITVQDDDGPVVGLAQTSYTVIEGTDSSVRVCAVLRAPQGGLARGFTVTLTANAGTAEQGRDYMASDYTATRTFQARSDVTVGTERCFSLTILDDNIGESIETFTITLSPNEPRVTVEGSNVATVTIEDNDIVDGGLMPGSFQVTATGSRSLSFSWSAPSQPTHPIVGYTVSCSLSGGEPFMMNYTAAGTHEERGFLPYTTYDCTVFARIDGNRGQDATDTHSVQTHEEAPGSAPTNVVLRSVTSISIELSWEQPSQSYGLITHYTLYINYTNGTEIARRTVIQSTATIAQLQPYQNVRVAISASNSAGEGVSQTTFSARTNESSPGLVREVRFSALNDTALSVSWMPPARLNGELQHYTVWVSSPLNGSFLQTNTTSLSVQLTGLEPFVPYEVSVLAVNSAGEGEAYTNFIFSKEGIPSRAPLVVSLERLGGGTSMRITWELLTLLEARGLPSYAIYYWPAGAGISVAMIHNVHGMNSTVLSGLDPNQAYSARVAASTSAGVGVLSELHTVKILETAGSNTYVWGVVGGGLAFTLVTVLIITSVIVGFCYWRSRPKKTLTEDHNKETCVTSPEYEEIQLPERGKAAGDVRTDKCVAYGMVNTGQQAGGDGTQLTVNTYDTVALY